MKKSRSVICRIIFLRFFSDIYYNDWSMYVGKKIESSAANLRTTWFRLERMNNLYWLKNFAVRKIGP